MTSLTFHGGVNEIGGYKILLEDKGTKIFLDFGMSFGAANKHFPEVLESLISLRIYIGHRATEDGIIAN